MPCATPKSGKKDILWPQACICANFCSTSQAIALIPINLNPPQLSELSEATVVVVPPSSYSELHKTSHLLELQPGQDRQ